MKKIFSILTLGMVSVMCWAEVSISVNPNVIDLGTVNLNKNGEAEGEATATLSWSGLIEYCSVFVDTIGVMPEDCEFYATALGGADYWYGGDMWTAATDPTVYVGYYAIAPGEYSIKYSFYSFTDDNWTVKSQGAELIVKVKVQALGTDVESIQPSAVSVQKIKRDGKIYILRGEKMYDLTGKIAQ